MSGTWETSPQTSTFDTGVAEDDAEDDDDDDVDADDADAVGTPEDDGGEEGEADFNKRERDDSDFCCRTNRTALSSSFFGSAWNLINV